MSSSMVSEIRNNCLKKVAFRAISTLYNISILTGIHGKTLTTRLPLPLYKNRLLVKRSLCETVHWKRKELKEELKLDHH